MNNERGVTLVELLATITIIALVVIFIISLQIIIQKQYSTQTEDTQQLTDITIAVKSITGDIRSAEKVTVSTDHKSITIERVNGTTVAYKLNGETLQKNGANYLYEIADFYVEKDDDKIDLMVKSKKGKTLKTEIVLRKGDVNEGPTN